MKFTCYIAFSISLLSIHPIVLAGNFNHTPYDSLLKENVGDGLVDYSAIKEDPSQLIRYLAQLEKLDSMEYKNWNDREKIAFWINAYNALTIYGVIQNYPIKTKSLISTLLFPKNSIRQIPGFWKTVFNPVMGKEITLDEIEHDILRKEFDEPRIHFALVCASIGCPNLQIFAYHPDSLDIQLDRAAWEFIQTKGAVINEKKNQLYVSRIFDWYADDFNYSEFPDYLMSYDDDKRGFLKFIVDHSGRDLMRFIRENNPKMKYPKYEWSLNEWKR
jgi:hypothetical protein